MFALVPTNVALTSALTILFVPQDEYWDYWFDIFTYCVFLPSAGFLNFLVFSRNRKMKSPEGRVLRYVLCFSACRDEASTAAGVPVSKSSAFHRRHTESEGNKSSAFQRRHQEETIYFHRNEESEA
jgi:hypothetical protein